MSQYTEEVLITADDSSLESTLHRASGQVRSTAASWSSSLTAAGRKLDTIGKSVDAAGKKMMSFGRSATTYLTLPLVGVGIAAVKMANDFETGFKQLVALADTRFIKLNGGLDKVKQKVLSLANATGQSAIEVTKGLYSIASAGLAPTQVMSVLEMSAKGATAGMGDLQTIAQTLTTVLNSYRGTGLTATSAMNILTAAIKAGKAEPADYAANLGTVADAAAKAGVSFQDLLAGLAKASNTMSLDQAATSFRFLMQNLVNLTPKATEGLKSIGISAQDLFRQLHQPGGLESALQGIADKLDITTQKGLATFYQIVGGARGAKAAMTLVGDQTSETNRILGETGAAAKKGATDFQDAYRKVTTNNPAFAMQKAFNQLKTSVLELGTVLVPIITKDVLPIIRDVVDGFNGLDPGMKHLVVLGGLAVAALGPVLIVLGGITRLAGNAIRGVGWLLRLLGSAKIGGKLGNIGTGGLGAAATGLDGAATALDGAATALDAAATALDEAAAALKLGGGGGFGTLPGHDVPSGPVGAVERVAEDVGGAALGGGGVTILADTATITAGGGAIAGAATSAGSAALVGEGAGIGAGIGTAGTLGILAFPAALLALMLADPGKNIKVPAYNRQTPGAVYGPEGTVGDLFASQIGQPIPAQGPGGPQMAARGAGLAGVDKAAAQALFAYNEGLITYDQLVGMAYGQTTKQSKALDYYTGKVKALVKENPDAATAAWTKALKQAGGPLKDTANKTETLSTKVMGAAHALGHVNQAHHIGTETANIFRKALGGMDRTLQDGADKANESTNRMHAYRDALGYADSKQHAVARSIRGVVSNMGFLSTSTDQAGTHAKASSVKFDSLMQAVDSVPDRKEVPVTDGADPASGRFHALRAAVDAVPASKSITVTANTDAAYTNIRDFLAWASSQHGTIFMNADTSLHGRNNALGGVFLHAAGAVLTRPTMFRPGHIGGEAGPEGVIPLNGRGARFMAATMREAMRQTGGVGGPRVNLDLRGAYITVGDLEQRVEAAVDRSYRRKRFV